MKKSIIQFSLVLSLLLLQLLAAAQELQQPLDLSTQQTTSLIFPFRIKAVDRGSGDILAQVPPQVENVLLLKATRPAFPPTNLTVITSDGRLYSFPVRYAASPAAAVIRLEAAPGKGNPVDLSGSTLREDQLQRISGQLVSDARLLYSIEDRKAGASVSLEGIYVLGNTLFYRLVVFNGSPLPYQLDFVRFTTRDRQQARRTARQEQEQTPLYCLGQEGGVVGPGEQRVLVFALEKFPLPNGKRQRIQLFENMGSRHLSLLVRPGHLRRACTLRLQ